MICSGGYGHIWWVDHYQGLGTVGVWQGRGVTSTTESWVAGSIIEVHFGGTCIIGVLGYTSILYIKRNLLLTMHTFDMTFKIASVVCFMSTLTTWIINTFMFILDMLF